jgi:hypothetical protein
MVINIFYATYTTNSVSFLDTHVFVFMTHGLSCLTHTPARTFTKCVILDPMCGNKSAHSPNYGPYTY